MEYNPEKMPGKIAPPNSTAQSLFESAYGIQPLNSSGEEGGGFASPTQLQQFLEGLGVAHNSTTPPEILATLAQDKDWSVRKEVAWNPNVPPELRQQLSADSDPRVRDAAMSTRSPGDFQADPD